jgi:D-3-phosphoglycerate dehydrogenase
MTDSIPKVLFIDKVHPLIREQLASHGFQCDHFPDYRREDFLKIIGQYTGIVIRSGITLDREMLSRAEQLRFIGRVGSGMENIDTEYAASKGISCLNSPEGNRDAVGEHTVGMLLSLMNHLNRADRQVREGNWIREGNRGEEIAGKTVAIIGYGNMGSAFAQKLSGFGASVISYDKYKADYSDGNTQETGMDEVFETADVVSLHVPLTGETEHLADRIWIGKFRKPFRLINTSRGKVVRTGDLAEGLKTGKILGAALDVLEYEDQSFEALGTDRPEALKYLMEAENVIMTPHIAGWTKESDIRLAEVLVRKILLLMK